MGEIFVGDSLVNWKLEKSGRGLERGGVEEKKKGGERERKRKERKEKVCWGRD